MFCIERADEASLPRLAYKIRRFNAKSVGNLAEIIKADANLATLYTREIGLADAGHECEGSL